jgi:hypothetical protein
MEKRTFIHLPNARQTLQNCEDYGEPADPGVKGGPHRAERDPSRPCERTAEVDEPSVDPATRTGLRRPLRHKQTKAKAGRGGPAPKAKNA